MKLIHKQLGIRLEFKENIMNVLVVENPKVLTRLIDDFREQCLVNEGNWVLSESDIPISMKKYLFIILEPFSLDCNSKRILAKIYQNLEKEENCNQNQLRAEFNKSLMTYLDSICVQSDVPLTYCDEIDFQDILKMAKVQVDLHTDSLLEKVLEQILLEHQLFGTRLFVFLNLKAFLSEEEIQELYQECFYKKIDLLLIESNYVKKMDNESICIIDKDCCLIYL